MSDSGDGRRRSERREPAHPVRIAAESEIIAEAGGQALNLSAGGACVALETADFSVGDELILWMHFARPAHPVPATGRIVWTSPGRGRGRYGVEWTHVGPQRGWIDWLSGV